MPGREIGHLAVGDVHQIAADRPIIGAERDTKCRRFERRPAGVAFQRVVAEEAQGGDIARRRERRGHVVHERDLAHRHGTIGVRHPGGLQRRAIVQIELRLIGRAVGNNDGVFHLSDPDP